MSSSKVADEITNPRVELMHRMPALDGLRTLAITMVFLVHYADLPPDNFIFVLITRLTQNFWIGVDLFFVLSGFLITGILYDTQRDSQYFKRFFARRAMRIFPLYYGVFLLIVLAVPIMNYELHWAQFPFLIYIGNFFANSNPKLYSIFSVVHPAWTISISHFWTLCVEEQFYLIWPFVVWMVRDRVKLLRIAVVICIFTLLMRFFMQAVCGPEITQLYFGETIFCHADGLLIGGILALLLRGKNAEVWQRNSKWVFLVAATLMSIVFFKPVRWAFWVDTIGLTLTALTSAGLIGMAIQPSKITYRIFNVRPLRMIGKYSYGFYVYHYLFVVAWRHLLAMMIGWVHSALLALLIYLPVVYAVSLLVSKISYDFFESRFLRLKKNFEYDARTT